MTLNGVITLTSPNRGVMLPNSVAVWTDYVKVVEDTLGPNTFCSGNVTYRPKNVVLAIYYLLRYSRRLPRKSALRKIEYRNFGGKQLA